MALSLGLYLTSNKLSKQTFFLILNRFLLLTFMVATTTITNLQVTQKTSGQLKHLMFRLCYG